MKKLISLLTVISLLALTACSAGGKTNVNATTENSTTTTTVPTTTALINRLTEAEVKSLAFAHAGVKTDEVEQVSVELEWNDDRNGWEYDIEFRIGTTEYEYEINAKSGTIISSSKETNEIEE